MNTEIRRQKIRQVLNLQKTGNMVRWQLSQNSLLPIDQETINRFIPIFLNKAATKISEQIPEISQDMLDRIILMLNTPCMKELTKMQTRMMTAAAEAANEAIMEIMP